jgi:cytochrome c-type biogenesis protein CcmH
MSHRKHLTQREQESRKDFNMKFKVLLCDFAALRRGFCVVLLLAAAVAARAGEAVPTENDPVAAARAVQLAAELRCLVCQNQSIADSNAELAVDLRRQIREQIAAGRSDREIVDFMVARYGDFVLYRPPFKLTTLLLWLGPLLLVAAGTVVLARQLRAQRGVEAPPLTPEERRRARRILSTDPDRQP